MVDLPDIGAEDIAWACDVLGLPPHAFEGEDGTDPRHVILCNNQTLDVEACPGSGKTTLLVAKLAILARHWKSRDQGICVISHTNAARNEIEKKLGTTSEGQRLLSYPHFVGTIHGFVNEYLALPWLRSKGATIKAIDDELCLDWRWRLIPYGNRAAIEYRRKGSNVARYKDVEHTPKDFGFGEHTPTFQSVREACIASTAAGLYCHEEMFVWAGDLIEKHPESISTIRHRFPILFIDEVQDNSEIQSALLYRVFIDGAGEVTRQRFGDQNQAIYDYSGEDGAATDPFPTLWATQTIPNSHRFGPSIASLADPLAIVPQALVGQGGHGPKGEAEMAGQHVVLLFEEADIEAIIPTYISVLRENFGPEELVSGDFTAVAAVHATDEANNVPRSVRHYWPEYDPVIARSDPQPKRMIQFVRAAHKVSSKTGEAAEAVEVFAKGVLKLARLMNPDANISVRRFKHRYVIELLGGDETRIRQYQDLVSKLVIDRSEPTQETWEGEFGDHLTDVAMVMSETGGATQSANEFLGWIEGAGAVGAESKPLNIVRDSAQQPLITVRLGSIHSVKGETHTATLVLESFNRTHHLKALKRWLLGTKTGGGNENASTLRRLKLHYVAMTRPSRLLCVAMRADSFSDAEIDTLKGRGWRVARVGADNTLFL